ncbi:SDR family NAD(P)-dependent oxidoreductase [Nocardia sp. NPDC050793]|uniref:SDR family NAD(P)-dependent oxidoreductase n=1 Tax=Nocardia sp. NPDC050793 TaxID=3155159 RepID=UPI0033FCAEF5
MTTAPQPTSALITGGNKGLGLETACRLGEQGWTIFLGSRDRGRGQTAADQLTARGVDVTMIPLDVTSDRSVADAVNLVRQHTDRLDVLVNNAGAAGAIMAPAEATVEEVHSVYNTNVYGPIRVTNAFLPLLRVADNPRQRAALATPRSRLSFIE